MAKANGKPTWTGKTKVAEFEADISPEKIKQFKKDNHNLLKQLSDAYCRYFEKMELEEVHLLNKELLNRVNASKVTTVEMISMLLRQREQVQDEILS